MIIYRAEYEDGGGPYYYRDGTPRNPTLPNFKNDNDHILSGADSIEHLILLMNNYGFDIKQFIIKEYESDNIITYNKKNGHINFKEKTND